MLLLLPPAKTPERGATGLGARPPVHFEWFARRVASARPDELQKCKRSCLSRKQGGRCQLLKYEQLKNEPPEQSRLGKSSTYSDQYDASLLFPIPRAAKRAEIGLGDKPPFLGTDLWTSHELSWLNLRGKPQVALAHFTVPCETPNIEGCGEITPRMLVCIVRNACRAPNGAKEAPTFESATTPNLKQNSALELITMIKP